MFAFLAVLALIAVLAAVMRVSVVVIEASDRAQMRRLIKRVGRPQL